MNSILTSIKKMLGIEESYTHFDPELILFINSVFGILFQLGVGPKDAPFTISDSSSEWGDFIQDNQIETVKSYVFAKVKLLFDPPSSSFVLSSYQDLIKEFEWRCHIDAETP
jgi:hypothetical protein